ncbi:MAG: hypothetical protein GX575_13085 [Candidatus Anammoximicrobium sp.]|nr:hypothetical protein [Candidatus Anammoximicrobium sp.]
MASAFDPASSPVATAISNVSRRVVVLGASNVVRAISTIVETAELIWESPLDVLAACGHGRSYGRTSCVLGRSLPGILQCGLWDDLLQRPALPTAALVTDIGNDILYGASAGQIAEWVEQCLERLRERCERIVVTELPLARLASVTPWQYRLVRTLLFPGSRVTFEEALQRVREVNARVIELAAQYRAVVRTPRRDWYGLDPIHLRRAVWSSAWREILSGVAEGATVHAARGSWGRWWQLRRQRPQSRRLFGIAQRRAQPACVLRSGSAISLY